MWSVGNHFRYFLIHECLMLGGTASFGASAQLFDGETKTFESLPNTQVRMRGRSELHITGADNPIKGSKIELNSEDAWVFIHSVRPSAVADDFLGHIRVDGKPASLGHNVRVVQYGEGTVVIPHPEDYRPLEVFSASSYMGVSIKLEQYVEYDSAKLGSMEGRISSFILKRGYMATFAENRDGTGHSTCYVAQDCDITVPILPKELNNRIHFVRVFPWRWIGKKGSCDVDPTILDAKWHYNWNINNKSTLDWEYVVIKQQPNWPGLNHDWRDMGVSHLLGYNEPNNKVEDGYKNLNPPGSVDNAVERWPELLGTGLRLGSPAVTDGGRGWILDFMKKAKAKNYRVDFIAIHYYRSFWNKDDPEGAARQFYNFLKDIHDQTGLPIWVTEWNNGANWTDSNHDPSPSQQEKAVATMIKMLDETPWVERYAIYSNVEDFRKVVLNGELTGAGKVYRDEVSPIGYRQPPGPSGLGPDAVFIFDNDFCDVSGNGNNALAFGSPEFSKMGQSISLTFDGENDYLKLPPRPASLFGSRKDFSFAAWIRWGGGESNQRIFDFGDGEDKSFYLTPSYGGRMVFVIKNGEKELRMSDSALEPGKWTHVVITVTEGHSKMYVNGKLEKESQQMRFETVDLQTVQNYIGRGQGDAGPLFRGQIYEARFLSQPLTDQQVAGMAARILLNFDKLDLKFQVTAGMGMNDSLAGRASGGQGTLTYKKAAGPDWLTIQPDGKMGGSPTSSDVGENRCLVTVQDAGGRIDAKYMTIEVR